MEPTMTSATSATSSLKTRRAFTLVELLVVIGIIVILASIGVPMGLKAYKAAQRSRIQADLNTISVGLEAFKGDFEDYPRPDSSGANSGFACLGRYLIGPDGAGTTTLVAPTSPYSPGDCLYTGSGTTLVQYVCVNKNVTTSPPTADWAVQSFLDGHDGPGIKKPIGGRVYGPYLQPDKFKMRGLAILDTEGNPILYFPASPAKPNIHAANGYVGTSSSSLYNANDGEIFFRQPGDTNNTNSVHILQSMLGDTSLDGQIGPGETEATTGPYLLWSAGPDGIFGPLQGDISSTAIQKCDDVTNFSK
jgi:prepilin-type N-terminal cleavage/methylation domain-containing protein